MIKTYQIPQSPLEKEKEKEILQWNGISKESISKKFIRRYKIFVYQLECFALYQLTSSQSGSSWVNQKKRKWVWKRMDVHSASKPMQHSIQLAVRSLYVLGYDLGVVDIGVTSYAPKYHLINMKSGQPLSPVLEEALQRAKNEAARKQQQASQANIVMGADIEFVLRHESGKFVLASQFLSRFGRVGYDAIWLRGHRNKYPIVELRPAPASDPENLFRNIVQCMRIASKKINRARIHWLAGGQPLRNYPIGGHIHFSRIKRHAQLLRALDNYISLPLFLLESKDSMTRRPKYGFLGDYRDQFHGGFEYRTPPSWITHPRIARGVLAIAKVVAKDSQKLTFFPLSQHEIQKAFYQGNKQPIYTIAPSLQTDLQACPSYSTHKRDIDSFFQLIEERFVWDEYTDIRKVWRIPPYHRKPASP